MDPERQEAIAIKVKELSKECDLENRKHDHLTVIQLTYPLIIDVTTGHGIKAITCFASRQLFRFSADVNR
jgi:hypothetical protein